jgi:hypothetical protein
MEETFSVVRPEAITRTGSSVESVESCCENWKLVDEGGESSGIIASRYQATAREDEEGLICAVVTSVSVQWIQLPIQTSFIVAPRDNIVNSFKILDIWNSVSLYWFALKTADWTIEKMMWTLSSKHVFLFPLATYDQKDWQPVFGSCYISEMCGLRAIRWRVNWESCITRSFMICNLRQV